VVAKEEGRRQPYFGRRGGPPLRGGGYYDFTGETGERGRGVLGWSHREECK